MHSEAVEAVRDPERYSILILQLEFSIVPVVTKEERCFFLSFSLSGDVSLVSEQVDHERPSTHRSSMVEWSQDAMFPKDEVELLSARVLAWVKILVGVVEQFCHRFDCSLSVILDQRPDGDCN